MNKFFFPVAACIALSTSGFAATTTTTISVPGAAKSIATSTPPGGGRTTTIDCTSGLVCYEQTTTTTDFVLQPGDKVELHGNVNGIPFHAVGGYINISESVNPEGMASHTYELAPTWNN